MCQDINEVNDECREADARGSGDALFVGLSASGIENFEVLEPRLQRDTPAFHVCIEQLAFIAIHAGAPIGVFLPVLRVARCKVFGV